MLGRLGVVRCLPSRQRRGHALISRSATASAFRKNLRAKCRQRRGEGRECPSCRHHERHRRGCSAAFGAVCCRVPCNRRSTSEPEVHHFGSRCRRPCDQRHCRHVVFSVRTTRTTQPCRHPRGARVRGQGEAWLRHLLRHGTREGRRPPAVEHAAARRVHADRHPGRLQPDRSEERRPHGGDRRRVRLPDPRGGPGTVPQHLRAAAVHDRERLPADLNQHGGTALPKAVNTDWDLEQALDVDIGLLGVPGLQDHVFEANAVARDLGDGRRTRPPRRNGVVAISNSYGGGNSTTAGTTTTRASRSPRRPVTAATSGGSYPACDTHVVAVGGTSVVARAAARGYTEAAWSGAGSGCGVNPQPSWQTKAMTTCTTKAMADVSAAADPGLGGLNVYYNGRGSSGRWHQRGVADHRRGLRAVGQGDAATRRRYLYATERPERHHERQQRQLRHAAVRRGQGLGRSDGPRHSARHQGVLTLV